jgi:hypothetical protein
VLTKFYWPGPHTPLPACCTKQQVTVQLMELIPPLSTFRLSPNVLSNQKSSFLILGESSYFMFSKILYGLASILLPTYIGISHFLTLPMITSILEKIEILLDSLNLALWAFTRSLRFSRTRLHLRKDRRQPRRHISFVLSDSSRG